MLNNDCNKCMNFKLIEGDIKEWEIYETFKEYYCNHPELTMNDIQQKLNLTSSQLRKLQRHTTEETGKKRNGRCFKNKTKTEKYLKKYDEFKELYVNTNLTNDEIRDKLDLSRWGYELLQKKLKKETGYVKKNQYRMDCEI